MHLVRRKMCYIQTRKPLISVDTADYCCVVKNDRIFLFKPRTFVCADKRRCDFNKAGSRSDTKIPQYGFRVTSNRQKDWLRSAEMRIINARKTVTTEMSYNKRPGLSKWSQLTPTSPRKQPSWDCGSCLNATHIGATLFWKALNSIFAESNIFKGIQTLNWNYNIGHMFHLCFS